MTFDSSILRALLPTLFAAPTILADCDPLTLSINGDIFGPNDTIEVTIEGVPGTLPFLLVDTELGPTFVPGIGTIALGLSSDLLVFEAPPFGEGASVLCAVAPGCPFSLLGVSLFAQAVALDPVEIEFCFSNVETLLVADLEGECGSTGPAEGCTPGFWKNHPELWDEPGDPIAAAAGFATDTSFNEFFNLTEGESGFPDSLTMLDALKEGGGGPSKLGRHGVSALLNLAAGLDYDLPVGMASAVDLMLAIQGAYLTDTFEPLATQLSDANEEGCPF